MKGKRRKDRQKKRILRQLKTGLGGISRAAEDRTRWKGIVVKSSVVP